MSSDPKLVVIGLGYVGLPLAVALARHFDVVGFDIDTGRIDELRTGHDRTEEIEAAALRESSLKLSFDSADLPGRDIYIVTVPTPVDADNQPDLGAVLGATKTVGRAIAGRAGGGAIVVYESTVYPGVTEDVCGPALAEASGLVCGADFFLGYSPERINPGDREHTVDRITKVVAGQTPDVTDILAEVYGRVTSGGVFRARDIKTAEAAKVIENAQRDINIAFVNEVAMILGRLGVSVQDVLDAANTKWNFLPFRPGLVGGHCIGVDPFYLAHAAQKTGHDPEIILAGRRINDGMGAYVAKCVVDRLNGNSGRVLVLGLTFKENVPDLRNSKVIDIVTSLKAHGCSVDVHDPHADAVEARHHYGLDLLDSLKGAAGYDAVVGAVQHDEYLAFSGDDLSRLLTADGLIADVKGMWRRVPVTGGIRRWQL